MNGWKTLLVVTMATAAIAAQTPGPTPAFEVASIKRNKATDGRTFIAFQPGGRLTATGVTVRALMAMAYGGAQPLPDSRILGGPGWLRSDHFDVVAKADGDGPPGLAGPMPQMLRALLADRFKLRAHNETRELPIYALVKARSDGKLGRQLRTAAVDCAAVAAARGRGAPPAGGAVAPAARGPALGPDGRPVCGIMIGPANITAGCQTIAQFASLLSGRVQRPIVDRTGLSGTFDIDLTWTPDQIPQGPAGGLPPNGPPLPAIDPNGPSIFTAVQEQLGLKLESTKGPVDVVVIDSVEQPTED